MPDTSPALLFLTVIAVVGAVTMHDLLHSVEAKRTANYAVKRTGRCPPWKPFQCPDKECIPIKYLCDGSPDCDSGYDENANMCTAALRPPVEETENFLKALLESHGKDFLSKIFGPKAADAGADLGGVHQLAIALSESPNVEDFGRQLELNAEDVKQTTSVLRAIADGQATGFEGNEASDFNFFAQKLIDTGFL